jgi:hypothetical protein
LPAAQPRPVAALQRRAHLAERRHGLVDGRAQRVAVGQVDAFPQRGVRAGHARGVAEARTRLREPGLLPQRPGGLGDEQVGQHVREVRDRGHEVVVGLGVDHRRPRAEAGDRAVQALEEDARRRRRGRQVPRLAVEEVLAGVVDTARLPAGQRMPADEALVVAAGDHGAFRGADVGHHAARGRRGERRTDGLDQVADRHRDEDRVRVAKRIAQRQRVVGRPACHGALGLGTDPADASAEPAAGGQADRPADEPRADDRDDHTVVVACFAARKALPATAAARSTWSA